LDRKKYDLCDLKSLKNFVKNKNVIIHLAAQNIGTMDELIRVNVLGTACLLEAISLYGQLTKFIFISSVQVYLKNKMYGLTKRIGEELVEYFDKEGKIEAIILRMTNLYGLGCKPFYNSAITTFMHQAIKGEEIVINGNGDQERDYLYVSDSVDAIMKAIIIPSKKVLYLDICSDVKQSLNEVLDIIRSVCKKSIKVRYNKNVNDIPWEFNISSNEAKQVLNWIPKVNLKKGIEITMSFTK
jgi:nucleoside-diphosphate-sugar epimerase